MQVLTKLYVHMLLNRLSGKQRKTYWRDWFYWDEDLCAVCHFEEWIGMNLQPFLSWRKILHDESYPVTKKLFYYPCVDRAIDTELLSDLTRNAKRLGMSYIGKGKDGGLWLNWPIFEKVVMAREATSNGNVTLFARKSHSPINYWK